MENNILAPDEKLFQEIRTTTYRKEEFSYIHTGIVDASGDTWTTTGMDEANIFQVYNQYRVKHSIPFPDEIEKIRKHYGLSAAKMSLILGFGINQYRMYEDGEVPSLSNARVLIASREKKVFLSFVEASKNEMSEAEYSRVRAKAEAADGDCPVISPASQFTGFRSVSTDKITAIVKLFITEMGATFVTKMNKLLFYADFIHYKKHGYGISGLKYRAMQYGPVPESWSSVYGSLNGLAMEEFVYPGGQCGVQLTNLTEPDSEMLTEDEISTIKKVCKIFSGMNAGEISNVSHQEIAWINNHANCSLISYQDAFSLNFD